MARNLSGSIALALSIPYKNTVDLRDVLDPVVFNFVQAFSDGTGANQAQQVFADIRTLTASSTEDLDINGTSLQDGFGTNVALTKVRAIIVVAAAANTNDVVVGGAATNGFISPFGAATDKVKVQPGGMFALVNGATSGGYAAVAATADLLRIGNGGAGTSVDYTIIIIGS